LAISKVGPMSFKQFLVATIIALSFLLIQFKLVPTVSTRIKNRLKEKVSPVEKIEQVKFDLIYLLKDSEIEIISGPVSRPEIEGIEFILKIKDQPTKVIFSSRRDGQSQLASLQLILKKSKIFEDKRPKMIDLTGSKPYVSF